MKIEVRRAVAQFEGIEPSVRPAIPRVHTSKKLAILVAMMNRDVLPPNVISANDLESWHLLV